jgi:hypothetical protein
MFDVIIAETAQRVQKIFLSPEGNDEAGEYV